MLKTIGLCVIMISGAGLGFAAGGELAGRKRTLEMILRMIILLRGEIRYGNKSLYDAFMGASGKLEGTYREFFILTAQEMRQKTARSFGEIFRECAGKCLGLDWLSRVERDNFYSLGDKLGYLGLDMQLKQLDQMEKETEYAIRELEKDFREKRKLYRSMGILVSSAICKDAGYQTIGTQIDLFCKLSIMVLSMPVLLAILDTISEFMI